MVVGVTDHREDVAMVVGVTDHREDVAMVVGVTAVSLYTSPSPRDFG